MNKSNGLECLAWTWGISALVATFVSIALWSVGEWTFMQGAFVGVLCLLLLGALLSLMMCRAPLEPLNSGAANTGAAGPKTLRGAGGRTADTQKAAPVAARAAASPAAASPAVASPAAEASPAPTPAPKPAPTPTPAPAAQAPEPAAQEASSEPAGVDYDGDGKVEGVHEGTRPAALDGPRGGQADDLKRIKGVGPKMEQLCNSLGFYHFDQIAAWTPDEVAWVDANLEGFKGRVSRDTWVDQAKLLASGGETEFSKKVDDGDVY